MLRASNSHARPIAPTQCNDDTQTAHWGRLYPLRVASQDSSTPSMLVASLFRGSRLRSDSSRLLQLASASVFLSRARHRIVGAETR